MGCFVLCPHSRLGAPLPSWNLTPGGKPGLARLLELSKGCTLALPMARGTLKNTGCFFSGHPYTRGRKENLCPRLQQSLEIVLSHILVSEGDKHGPSTRSHQ